MTVKRLPHLQKGRLETILLPVLVSAATAVVGNVARPAEEEDSKKNKSSDNIKGKSVLQGDPSGGEPGLG